MKLRYARHAGQKFKGLKRHGFEVTQEQVEETLQSPEAVFPQEGGQFIAQKTVSERHLLWVVFRAKGEVKVVITFYPAQCYENRV